ncbi:MAG TPA: phosphatidylglycerophosphatase A, partial [Stellaceae bacterium]
PVRWFDRHVAGGLGIMLDDVAAAGYAALVLEILSAVRGASGVHG